MNITASHVTRARADRSQAAEVAVGIDSTSAIARVLADSVVTSWSRSRAVNVAEAFRTTLGERRSNVALGALANCAMVRYSGTRSSLATLTTSFCTLPLVAIFLRATFAVRLALVSAACEG